MEVFATTILIIAMGALVGGILMWFWKHSGDESVVNNDEKKDKNKDEKKAGSPKKTGTDPFPTDPGELGTIVNVPEEDIATVVITDPPKPAPKKEPTVIEQWELCTFDKNKNPDKIYPFELKKGQTIKVGRVGCEITLPDPAGNLSRVHASLSLGDGCLILKDEKSTNGCKKTVGGERLKTIEIRTGQKVFLGTMMVQFNLKNVRQDDGFKSVSI